MMVAEINIMSISPYVVYTIINILILFLFFRFFLFKPVNEILDKRKKMIADNIEAAEKEKTDAQALKKEYQQVLDDAEEETVKIMKDAKERAKIEYTK